MSYSIASIDGLYLKVGQDYLDALKKDLEEYLKDKDSFSKKVSSIQLQHLEDILNFYEADMSLDDFHDGSDDVYYYEYAENYLYESKVDIKTGKIAFNDASRGEGYYYPLYYSVELYKKPFENEDELLKEIYESLYIPQSFDIEKNLKFLSGIICG